MAQTLGTGLIILIVLWFIALGSVLLFCTAQGGVRMVAVLFCGIAAIVTVILLVIPSESQSKGINYGPSYNYSYTSLIWILTLTIMCMTLIGSALVYLITDVLEPHYAHVSRLSRKM